MALLLRIAGLSKEFDTGRGAFLPSDAARLSAVDDVSFHIDAGETLGLVGESGCGKSTIGRCVVRLVTPSSGKIEFEGRDVGALKGGDLRSYRRDVQMVFQNPYASLNPRFKVGELIGEPLAIHRLGTRAERSMRVAELLELVGLSPSHANRYPHEFSGGQRQRIGIARAIALGPKLVVCDEPVSALDASVRAQVTSLLLRLQEQLGLAYLFIAHDLSLVHQMADRVAVMYLGRIAEIAPASALSGSPLHPYTESLLSAVMVPDPRVQRESHRILLPGAPPSPADPPSGCRFHTRCPIAELPLCAETRPDLREIEAGHFAACHFARPFPIFAGTAPDSVERGEAAQP